MKPPKVGKMSAIRFMIDYIMNIEKTDENLIYGMNCNPQDAYQEMILTKHRFHKTDGRQYCHFIQSFSPKDNVTPELAHEIGQRLIQEFSQFDGFEIVMATHSNKSHIHNHFVLNSVNAETGLKWEQKARGLYLLKQKSNELCAEYSLSQILFGNKSKNGTDWKEALENNIRDCLGFCTSRPQFFHAMNELGVDVKWTNERKYVTFTLPDGKKCRNSKLSDTAFFSKENMQSVLDNNRDNMELINEIPDLFLDSCRLAGSVLNPSDPDYLIFKDLDKDLSNLEGRELLIAIESLKLQYALEVTRVKNEKERNKKKNTVSDILEASADFMEWYREQQEEELEI
jgi:hypothetical protein